MWSYSSCRGGQQVSWSCQVMNRNCERGFRFSPLKWRSAKSLSPRSRRAWWAAVSLEADRRAAVSRSRRQQQITCGTLCLLLYYDPLKTFTGRMTADLRASCFLPSGIKCVCLCSPRYPAATWRKLTAHLRKCVCFHYTTFMTIQNTLFIERQIKQSNSKNKLN